MRPVDVGVVAAAKSWCRGRGVARATRERARAIDLQQGTTGGNP